MINFLQVVASTIFVVFSFAGVSSAQGGEFNCKLKFKSFTFPSIAGCEMSLKNGLIIEKYQSFFGEGEVLKLNVCPVDPMSLKEAKLAAKQLIKVKALKNQGDENFWTVQLQGEDFYKQLDENTRSSWRELRVVLQNDSEAMMKSKLNLKVKTKDKTMQMFINGDLAAQGKFEKKQQAYMLSVESGLGYIFSPKNEVKTLVISADGGNTVFGGGC